MIATSVGLLVVITAMTAGTRSGAGLSLADAVVLGIVEGATEFVPVSSTGHLVVAERLLGVADGGASRASVDSFLIVIQGGAIAAVLLVYRRRIVDVARGVFEAGDGRRLGAALLVAASPAVAVAAVAGNTIKAELLEPLPVTIAWLVGGIVVVAVGRWFRRRADGAGLGLETIGLRTAAIIGCAQVLALWPGVSRSLVTVVAGLLVGLSIRAAVEFSFLLGALVLSLATVYEVMLGGAVGGLGWPAVAGVVVSFGAGLVAVRWMVGYLERHDIVVFGWYRIGVAAIAVMLMSTGVLQ